MYNLYMSTKGTRNRVVSVFNISFERKTDIIKFYTGMGLDVEAVESPAKVPYVAINEY